MDDKIIKYDKSVSHETINPIANMSEQQINEIIAYVDYFDGDMSKKIYKDWDNTAYDRQTWIKFLRFVLKSKCGSNQKSDSLFILRNEIIKLGQKGQDTNELLSDVINSLKIEKEWVLRVILVLSMKKILQMIPTSYDCIIDTVLDLVKDQSEFKEVRSFCLDILELSKNLSKEALEIISNIANNSSDKIAEKALKLYEIYK